MHDIGALQIISVLFVLIAIALIATSVIGAAMVTAWGIVAMILKAFVCVPLRFLLLGIGGVIRLCGWLAGFATASLTADAKAGATTAMHAALRRSRLIKR